MGAGSLVRPGHPFGRSSCLVLNGGFEFVSLSAGANDGNARPGGLGAICCDGWHFAYDAHGCCATNDDRSRMLSVSRRHFSAVLDCSAAAALSPVVLVATQAWQSWAPALRHCCGQVPADPHSGRYSLRVVIPTTVPVWLPVPMLTKHAPGPLQNDTAYSFSLWVRSSPAGEHHRLHTSLLNGFHTFDTPGLSHR